jgi:hypothetical protein
MERCAFLIVDADGQTTSERLSCLLNPNTLVFRRLSGARPRQSLGGGIAQYGVSDDPLLQTGGGTTELRLDLLFDVNLPGTALGARPPAAGAMDAENPAPLDVRDLTRPFWNLAENRPRTDGIPGPPRVRFVWGKAWDFPALVVAVAERLECFTPEGVPQRSFLRLRLLRADDPVSPGDDASSTGVDPELLAAPGIEDDRSTLLDVVPAEETPEAEEYESYVSPGSPMFLTALLRFGDVGLWRKLSELNPDVDPVFVPPGTILRVPLGGGPATGTA